VIRNATEGSAIENGLAEFFFTSLSVYLIPSDLLRDTLPLQEQEQIVWSPRL
jgi:hypothetical protein